ncbi:hypothetical protein [Fulvivirga maritima]|uniref:hypothetical protein n=1 Tax=Fulvivirga maritima TaxID=2904247 RepID=UPI0027953121|nr:hypothetical protein [Fulvivirga maritima]
MKCTGGGIPTVTYAGESYNDLYTVTAAAFAEWWIVAFYTISMLALMFHLYHGFSSAFQTLGLNHPKYNPLIKGVGYGFAIIVPALFAVIPIIMFYQSI